MEPNFWLRGDWPSYEMTFRIESICDEEFPVWESKRTPVIVPGSPSYNSCRLEITFPE
jgi:hypothetical protein